MHGVVSPDRGRALYSVASVTRPGTTAPGRVRLPGLDPDLHYAVWAEPVLDPHHPPGVKAYCMGYRTARRRPAGRPPRPASSWNRSNLDLSDPPRCGRPEGGGLPLGGSAAQHAGHALLDDLSLYGGLGLVGDEGRGSGRSRTGGGSPDGCSLADQGVGQCVVGDRGHRRAQTANDEGTVGCSNCGNVSRHTSAANQGQPLRHSVAWVAPALADRAERGRGHSLGRRHCRDPRPGPALLSVSLVLSRGEATEAAQGRRASSAPARSSRRRPTGLAELWPGPVGVGEGQQGCCKGAVRRRAGAGREPRGRPSPPTSAAMPMPREEHERRDRVCSFFVLRARHRGGAATRNVCERARSAHSSGRRREARAGVG